MDTVGYMDKRLLEKHVVDNFDFVCYVVVAVALYLVGLCAS